MTIRTLLRVGAMMVGYLAGGALAADQVTFDLAFRGSVDCFSPEEYIDAPLSVKGTAVLRKDGTASADILMTAYYVIEARAKLEGKLGAPPTDIGGGTGQLRVANGNGLALILNYPDNRYVMSVSVNGRKCSASLVGEPTNSKHIYNIFALDTEFLCSRFELNRTSCKVH